MFTVKKKYFLIIESIKDIDLRNIKLINKYTIIYRNVGKIKNIQDVHCNSKKKTLSITFDWWYNNDFTRSLSDKMEEKIFLENSKRKKKAIGLIHKVYLAQLKTSRKYTACTKTKSEVRGGGKNGGAGVQQAEAVDAPNFGNGRGGADGKQVRPGDRGLNNSKGSS